MELIIIIIFILVILMFLKNNKNGEKISHELGETIDNKERKGNKINKLIYSIALFIPIFIAYYFTIAMVLMLLLTFIFGAESGGWAYGMLLGLCLSPIFTVITIEKLIYKKKGD